MHVSRTKPTAVLVLANDLTLLEMQLIRDCAANLVNEQSPSIFFAQRLILHLLYVIPEVRATLQANNLWNTVIDRDCRYAKAMQHLRVCEKVLQLTAGTGYLDKGNLHDAVLNKVTSLKLKYIIARGMYAELIACHVPIKVIHVDDLGNKNSFSKN